MSLVAMAIIGGCSRQKPMATAAAVPEPEEATVESSPTRLPVSTPIVPETTRYTVRAGDTLWAIARRFGVAIQALMEANEVLEPDRLQPGQELIIPIAGDVVSDELSPQERSLDESGGLESERIHIVTAGETLWSIAMRYGTTVDEIARLNELDPGQLPAVGQRLLIP